MRSKEFTLSLLCFFSRPFVLAQENKFAVGDKVVNLGIRFGGYRTWGYHATVPPISASFEVGVKDGILDVGSIGIGGFIAYASYKPSGYILITGHLIEWL